MIVGKRFENERIVVSGRRFERCVFVDCELVYRGGRVDLIANSFDGCRWAFEGPAAETLGFIGALCRDSDEFGMTVARALGLTRGAVH
jgi:hypothetical protein